jgi:hypothetical protein
MPYCYKDINLFGKEILKVVNYTTTRHKIIEKQSTGQN